MSNSPIENLELISAFVSEGIEMLDDIEPQLVELSSDDSMVDEETIHCIFRLFHTLKGTSGFFGFDVIKTVTHDAENLLDLFRKGKATLCIHHTDVLMKTCDFIRKILLYLESNPDDSQFLEESHDVKRVIAETIGDLTSNSNEPKANETEAAKTSRASKSAGSTVKAANKAESISESISENGGEIQIILPDDLISDNRGELPHESDSNLNNADLSTLDTAETDKSSKILHHEPKTSLDPGNDLLASFHQEAHELLDDVEQSILSIDADGITPELVARAFRGLHSFKGNCGFFGYDSMQNISHAMESVLQEVKEERANLSKTLNSRILETIDMLRGTLAELSVGGSGNIPDLDERIALFDLRKLNFEEGQTNKLIQENRKDHEELENLSDKADHPAARAADNQSRQAAYRKQDIRVDVTKLDSLINLIGELVLAEAMVVKNPDLDGLNLVNFDRASSHLAKVVRDLQDVAMSIRMVPIAGTFRKMIRLVHDLSNKAGKKVELIRIGEDTEVDKTVAELVSDPLVHIVRNAIDHGVESEDQRAQAGKTEPARVWMEAKHEGSEVWIIIRDNGRGLSKEKIFAKAVERGLVSTNSELSEKDIYKLIFEPGFSTAQKITDVSGRGVGMDVVKKNTERLGGKVDVFSTEGKGTVFILKIPLTLAIIDGMLIQTGTAKYIIPTMNIKESLRPRETDITTTSDGTEVIRIRKGLIPILRLYRLHNVKPRFQDLEKGILVVVENDGKEFALFIDTIIGQQQTVVKGLGTYINQIRGVSGCSILGDGSVCLILDVDGLLRIYQSL
ncbi:MAG: chemotaxis protein CheA [Candidatus Wallbacteria bacterium HGW-Wallbacteria-1]|jgi:two-component system chemotaxis sensor kinase CheA|uniref:Chemotaxis protein CheA n=1 Tax=Candidatus Wallbacteria bacterium HGW-Wallbacteria-1 TaxID=2013854 RepID=A0A2N1PIY4_9BACT|nr:MAG: chemotaxis protein CheA [Candidatus Wallbacteria bacterium HGW-Wallbacteria-1]